MVVNAGCKSLTDNAGRDIAPVIKSSAAVVEEAVVDADVVVDVASASAAVTVAAAVVDVVEAAASESARLTASEASGTVTSLTTAFLQLTSWALRLAQRERHLPS